MYALQHSERQISNIGGIESFLFTDAENLLYDPRPRRDLAGSSLVVESIPLINGAYWYQAIVTKFTVGFDERMRDRAQGESYDKELRGVIAKLTPQLAEIFRQFGGRRRFALIAKDYNGFYRLIGGKEYGLRFSYDTETGSSPRDRNQVSFSFEGSSVKPSPFYEGSLLNEIADPVAPELTARITEDGIYIRILE